MNRISWMSVLFYVAIFRCDGVQPTNVTEDAKQYVVVTKESDATLSCDGCTDSGQIRWTLDEHQLNVTDNVYNIVNVTELDVGHYVCSCKRNGADHRQEHRLTLVPEQRHLKTSMGYVNATSVSLICKPDVSYTNRFGVVHSMDFEREISVSYAEVLLGDGGGCSSGQLRLKPPVVVLAEVDSAIMNLAPGHAYVVTVNVAWIVDGQRWTVAKVFAYAAFATESSETKVYWKPYKNATLNADIGLTDCQYTVYWRSIANDDDYFNSNPRPTTESTFIWNVSVVIPDDFERRIAVSTLLKPTIGGNHTGLNMLMIEQLFKIEPTETELLTTGPVQLQCHDALNSSIRLTWSYAPPATVEHSTMFRVVHWEQYNVYWRKYVDIDSSKRELTITGLAPRDSYKFAIMAFDSADRFSKAEVKQCIAPDDSS